MAKAAGTTGTKGKCDFCNKEFAKGGMSTHLRRCKERSTTQIEDNMQPDSVDISISATWWPEYWMIVNVPMNATLADLDHYIRGIWFDPSDHLSSFRIGGREYAANPYGGMEDVDGADSADTKIRSVLRPGMEFEYMYDFGTTSYVKLRAGSPRRGTEGKGIIELARNNPPDIPCSKCGTRRAKWILTDDLYTGPDAALCTKCAVEEARQEYSDIEDNGYGLADLGYNALSNSPRTWQEPWDVSGKLLDLPDTL